MKTLLFILIVAMAQGAEANVPSTTLTLKNGKVFRNVKITSQTDDAIYVRYNAGMVKIFKSELSAEMQKKYPTPQQVARAEAQKQASEAAHNLTEIKASHAEVIAKITRPSPAEREILGMRSGQPVRWNLSFDDAGENLLFVTMKMPATATDEPQFVSEVPRKEFQNLVSMVRKFEDWSSICSQETPKPTVEKPIGNLGSFECIFRYDRRTGGTLWIGDEVMQEEDARHFLALSTALDELAAESREILKRNSEIAERLK